jgi:hypothetical protein
VFVTPDTVLRWQRRRFRKHWAKLSGKRQVGRCPSPNSSGGQMREAFDYGQRADAAMSDLERKNSRLGAQEKNE